MSWQLNEIIDDLRIENGKLTAQLADRDAEIENLNRQLDSFRESTKSDCDLSYCGTPKEISDIRKQTARDVTEWCSKIMKKIITSNVGCGDYKHNCAHFNEIAFREEVKKKYGLEG